MGWKEGVRSGLASWLRGRAAPAWTRRGEGTPPKPPPPRPFFIPPRLGSAGRRELVEQRLRGLVADDLAADSLDLLEIAIAAEEEFGIVIRERNLAAVRTYGDLLAEVSRLVPDERPQELPDAVWARVVSLEGAAALGARVRYLGHRQPLRRVAPLPTASAAA